MINYELKSLKATLKWYQDSSERYFDTLVNSFLYDEPIQNSHHGIYYEDSFYHQDDCRRAILKRFWKIKAIKKEIALIEAV